MCSACERYCKIIIIIFGMMTGQELNLECMHVHTQDETAAGYGMRSI